MCLRILYQAGNALIARFDSIHYSVPILLHFNASVMELFRFTKLTFSYQCVKFTFLFMMNTLFGEAGSEAVLSRRYAPIGKGSIHSPGVKKYQVHKNWERLTAHRTLCKMVRSRFTPCMSIMDYGGLSVFLHRHRKCIWFLWSILASVGFLLVLRFSLLHLKLNFLNNSVSKHFMDTSFKFNTFALFEFAWFSSECYKYNVCFRASEISKIWWLWK